MKKKIIGIFVCVIFIITALSASGTSIFQIDRCMKENDYLEHNQISSANSRGIITIKFVAKVSLIEDPYNLLGGAIKLNDKITGKYIYDSGVVDTEPHPKWGEYWFSSSTYGIEFKVGRLDFKTNPSNPSVLIQIANDVSFDQYQLFSENNLQLSNGMDLYEIGFQLEDSTGTVLSSDALPVTAPVLSDWDHDVLYSMGYNPSKPSEMFIIGANFTKFTKSKTINEYFTSQPVLNWLFEHFSNKVPILRVIMA